MGGGRGDGSGVGKKGGVSVCIHGNPGGVSEESSTVVRMAVADGLQENLVVNRVQSLADRSGIGRVVVDVVGLDGGLLVFKCERPLCWPAGSGEHKAFISTTQSMF